MNTPELQSQGMVQVKLPNSDMMRKGNNLESESSPSGCIELLKKVLRTKRLNR